MRRRLQAHMDAGDEHRAQGAHACPRERALHNCLRIQSGGPQSNDPMRRAPLLSAVAVLVAFAVASVSAAHAAVASGMTTARVTAHPAHAATVSKGAPAVHTAAHPVHHRSAHHRRPRHARHERVAASLGQTSPIAPRPSRGAPEVPRPARDHRTATVPQVSHGSRYSKTGSHHALATLANTARLAGTVQPLEARQNTAPDVIEDPVKSGRGPPRASPTAALPARPSREPLRGAAQHAPSSAFPRTAERFDPPTTRFDLSALSSLSTSPRLSGFRPGSAAASIAFPVSASLQPGLASGRPHAGRTEGQAACHSVPSTGGSTCLASSPSPHWLRCRWA